MLEPADTDSTATDPTKGQDGEIRVDAVALRSPRTLDDGTKVYDAVLAYAGRPLQYAWGTEIPTAQALSSKTYLDGLHGISVCLRHPPGDRVDQGRAPKVGKGRRVGTVCSSRFDESEGEAGAVIISMAIHEIADQAAVERLQSVSEGYRATGLQHLGPGRTAQTVRVPNHVAIAAAATARAPGAEVRIDEVEMDNPFDAAQALGLIAAADKRAGEAETRADEATARADTAEADLAKLRTDAEAAEATRADETAAQVDKLANERAIKLIDLQKRADELEAVIPETAVTFDERNAALAKVLGCPDGTDATAYISGIERARADSTSADSFRKSATTTQKGPALKWTV